MMQALTRYQVPGLAMCRSYLVLGTWYNIPNIALIPGTINSTILGKSNACSCCRLKDDMLACWPSANPSVRGLAFVLPSLWRQMGHLRGRTVRTPGPIHTQGVS